MSPNLAGVTFLAFGNGAPDVAGSVAAFASGNGDVGVAAVTGAGMFVTTVIAGTVAFLCEAKVNRRPFLRDVGFNLIALGYLAIIFADNKVHWLEATGFLMIYVVFALTVVIGRRVYQGSKAARGGGGGAMTLPLLVVTAAPHESRDDPNQSIQPVVEIGSIQGHLHASTGAAPARGWGTNRTPQDDSVLATSVQLNAFTDAQTAAHVMSRMRSQSNDWHAALTSQQAAAVDGAMLAAGPPSGPLGGGGCSSTSGGGVPVAASLAPTPKFAPRGQHRRGALAGHACLAAQLRGGYAGETPPPHLFAKHTHWAWHLMQALQDEDEVPLAALTVTHTASALDRAATWLEAHFGSKTPAGKALHYILLPTSFARWVTVPVLQEEDYDWRWVAGSAVLGLPFVVLTGLQSAGMPDTFWGEVTPGAGLPVYTLCLLLGACLALAMAAVLGPWLSCGAQGGVPSRTAMGLLVMLAFLTSVSWIINVANEIVTLLVCLGLLLNVSSSILGLTVLALGNSLGDLIADVTVAKEGYPSMAMGGVFAGCLFNLLIGLGLSLLVGAGKSDSGELQVQTDSRSNHIVIACFAFLAFSLLMTLVVVPLSGFVFTRKYGCVLFAVYTLYMTTCLVLQFQS